MLSSLTGNFRKYVKFAVLLCKGWKLWREKQVGDEKDREEDEKNRDNSKGRFFDATKDRVFSKFMCPYAKTSLSF